MRFEAKASLLTATVWLILGGAGWTARTAASAAAVKPFATGERPFLFLHEFYGNQGYADPQVVLNQQEGMFNGVTLWPPVEEGPALFARRVKNLMLRLPNAVIPAGVTAAEIERQRAAFEGLGNVVPEGGLFWSLMPEWDQGAGQLGAARTPVLPGPDAPGRAGTLSDVL